MAVLAAHLTQTPPPMNEAESKPRVPLEVERVVMQCLAKDPNLRPQTAHEPRRQVPARPPRSRSPLPGPTPGDSSWHASGSRLLAAVVFFVYLKNSQRTKLEKGDGGSVVSREGGKDGPKKTISPTDPNIKLWAPEGYKPVGKDYIAGPLNQPTRLKRLADGVEFDRFADGVYLPVGYIAETPGDLLGDWPLVIIRKSDQEKNSDDRVRFIRIKGKTFLCGDPRNAPDPKPRYVTVPDFYIQETEATNGLIEEFLKVYQDDEAAFHDWQEAYKLEEQKNPKAIHLFAAAAINYSMATKFARFLQGRLPTEVEWEYVAKSGSDDFLWPWGKETKKEEDVRKYAYLFNGVFEGPGVVKKFKKDRTEQGIYDMAGNLREWCLDVFVKPEDLVIPDGNAPEHPMVDDPSAVAAAAQSEGSLGGKFSVRGGSFMKMAPESMVFSRGYEGAAEEINDLGFRVLIECPPQPKPSLPKPSE